MREEKDKDQFVVFLTFNLKEQQIYFSRPEPFSNQSLYEYNYLGNNPGASMQYYLSRELNSLGYLLGTVFSDLYLMLKKYNLENNELGKIIQQIESANFIRTKDKKGQGTVNLEKLRVSLINNYTKIKHEKKALFFSKNNNEPQRYNYEQLLRQDMDDDNKRNQYTLIIPAVQTEDNQFIILSNHPDYVELVKKEKLGGAPRKAKKNPRKVCHLCGQAGKMLHMTSINLINPESIRYLQPRPSILHRVYKQNYDLVYALCNSCYQRLLAGKVMRERFHGQIAKENAYIIPESLLADFDYNNLTRIKTA